MIGRQRNGPTKFHSGKICQVSLTNKLNTTKNRKFADFIDGKGRNDGYRAKTTSFRWCSGAPREAGCCELDGPGLPEPSVVYAITCCRCAALGASRLRTQAGRTRSPQQPLPSVHPSANCPLRKPCEIRICETLRNSYLRNFAKQT